MSSDNVLEVRDLVTYFFLRRGVVKAVDGVSFDLKRGEVLGLVGESGCGKSLTALSIMRLLPKGGARTVRGEVRLGGENILVRSPRQMREIRGRRISMILQDPQTSLNPVFSIGEQLREAIFRRTRGRKAEVMKEAVAALRRVEIAAPDQRIGQFPHQLSGGMKQRVCIALAVALRPAVIIADEPTSALDVIVQKQVLRTLARVQRALGAAVVMVGHDMGLMAQFAHRIGVMYAGRLVELGDVRRVFADPRHPYTRLLIDSLPGFGQRGVFRGIPGVAPSLLSPPSGCPFHPRCPRAAARCAVELPAARTLADGRIVRCHFAEEAAHAA